MSIGSGAGEARGSRAGVLGDGTAEPQGFGRESRRDRPVGRALESGS